MISPESSDFRLYYSGVAIRSTTSEHACAGCASTRGSNGRLFERDGSFRLWRCSDCGTESWVAVDGAEGAESPSEYWDLQRFESYERDEVRIEYTDRYDRLRQLAGIDSTAFRHKRVADWGGGIGNLATWAKASGAAEVTVLDTDPRALAIAGERGLTTVEVDLLDEAARFNVIFAIDVIEHVNDPAGFLDALGRHLAPGGTVVLETPSSKFWLRHLARREQPPYFGRRLRHFLYYYEHKHYFSIKGLTALADARGFDVGGVRLVGSPRSKIAASAFPGTSTMHRVLRRCTSAALAALGRRNKIWMSLERRP